MEQTISILEGHDASEKGAYLSAIASLATADRRATEDEILYLEELCTAADLPENEHQKVIAAASETDGAILASSLDTLKKSDLRFSLVADLISFSNADQTYSEEEQKNVEKIATYLGVNNDQYQVLNQFSEKVANGELTPGSVPEPSSLSAIGMKDKMQAAGINTNGFLKGLIAFAAPMILASLLRKRGNTGTNSGGLGGVLGGLLGGAGLGSILGGMFHSNDSDRTVRTDDRGDSGGLGSILGGMFGQDNNTQPNVESPDRAGTTMPGGGLGSIIGMLSKGRGLGSAGDLIGKILGKK